MKRVLSLVAALLMLCLFTLPMFAAEEVTGAAKPDALTQVYDSLYIPEAVRTVFKTIADYFVKYRTVALIVVAVLALVFCFAGYRLRRIRYALLMLCLGAVGGWITSVLLLPDAKLWLTILIAVGAGIVFGLLGFFLWAGCAGFCYLAVSGVAVWSLLVLYFPSIGWIPRTVISGLIAVTVTVLLLIIVRHTEIIITALHGFLAAFVVMLLLDSFGVTTGLADVWYYVIELGGGLLLTVGGVLIQYLVPHGSTVNKEVKKARSAIKQSAAVDIDKPLTDAEKQAEEAGAAAEAKAEEVKEAVETKTEEAKETVEAKAEEVKEVVEAKAEEAKEVVETKAEEAKEVVEAKAEEAKEAAEAKVEEVKEAAPRVCPKCGAVNVPTYKFCMSCGHPLQ